MSIFEKLEAILREEFPDPFSRRVPELVIPQKDADTLEKLQTFFGMRDPREVPTSALCALVTKNPQSVRFMRILLEEIEEARQVQAQQCPQERNVCAQKPKIFEKFEASREVPKI